MAEFLQPLDTDALQIRIGTRKSDLALWQARHTLQELQKECDRLNHSFEIVKIATTGDRVLNVPLSKFSDKGVFTKELDVALLNYDIDCAVHCAKDLPSALPNGIVIAAFLTRGDSQDCVIINNKRHPNVHKLSELPANSIIGTSSVRRQAILRRLYPSFTYESIRGNLNTRIHKLFHSTEPQYDAIILAKIGIDRLQFSHYISETLSPHVMPYAIGQGALAIVCRDPKFGQNNGNGNGNINNNGNSNGNSNSKVDACAEQKVESDDVVVVDHPKEDMDDNVKSTIISGGNGGQQTQQLLRNKEIFRVCRKLNNTWCAVQLHAERCLLRQLEGGCKVPIAVRCKILYPCTNCGLYAIIQQTQQVCYACKRHLELDEFESEVQLMLYGAVYSLDGTQCIESHGSKTGKLEKADAERLADHVAQQLIEKGAKKIIEQIKRDAENE